MSRISKKPQAFRPILLSSVSLLAAGVTVSPAVADAELADTQGVLFQQSYFWEQEGRGDLALDALQRILQSDPYNARALYEVGRLHVRSGTISNARTFERRLGSVDGGDIYADRLRNEILSAEGDNEVLVEARGFSKKGDFENAVAAYERLFNNRGIHGDLALEYYQTLAGIDGRWEDARKGLETLYLQEPDNERALVAYLEVLTYNEETRREAIDQFLVRRENQAYRAHAEDHIRKSLLWLHATPLDKEYYDAYFDYAGDDTEILEKWGAVLNPPGADAFEVKRTAAYDRMKSGKIADAQKVFQSLHKERPSDAATSAGLGLVHLKRGQFASARQYLNRAIAQDRSLRKDLSPALHAATFWSAHRQANVELKRGEFDKASAILDNVKAYGVRERAAISMLKADIAQVSGNAAAARRHYETALDIDANNVDAIVGLARASLKQSNPQSLRQIASRISAARQSNDSPKLTGVLNQVYARLAQLRNDLPAASIFLRDAVAANPGDPWLSLEYAQLTEQAGDQRSADAIIAALRQSQSAEAQFAGAVYYARRGQWRDVVRLIDRIPLKQRSAGAARLRAEAQIYRDIADMASIPNLTERSAELRAFAARYQRDMQVSLAVAHQLMKIDKPAAAGVMRNAMSSARNQSVEDLVVAANILFDAGDFDAADVIIRDLVSRKSSMTRGQLAKVEQTYDQLIVRLAREAINKKQYGVASRYLEPAYSANPRSTEVLRAMGELSAAMGRHQDAMRYYGRASELDPSDYWAISGAVGAALNARKVRYAGEILDSAVSRFPNNPDVYKLVAKVAEAAGDFQTAIIAIEEARRLDAAGGAGNRSGEGRAPAPMMTPDNPFRRDEPSYRDQPAAPSGANPFDREARRPSPYFQQASFVPAAMMGGSDWDLGDLAKDTVADLNPMNGAPISNLSLAEEIEQELQRTRAAARQIKREAPALAAEIIPPQRNAQVAAAGNAMVSAPVDALIHAAEYLIEQGSLREAEGMIEGLLASPLSVTQSQRLEALTTRIDVTLGRQALAERNMSGLSKRMGRLSRLHARSREATRFLAEASEVVGDRNAAAGYYTQLIEMGAGDIDVYAGAARNMLAESEADAALSVIGMWEARGGGANAELLAIKGKSLRLKGDLDGAIRAFEMAQGAVDAPATAIASTSQQAVADTYSTAQQNWPQERAAPSAPYAGFYDDRASAPVITDSAELLIGGYSEDQQRRQEEIYRAQRDYQPEYESDYNRAMDGVETIPTAAQGASDIQQRLRRLGDRGPQTNRFEDDGRDRQLFSTYDDVDWELEDLRNKDALQISGRLGSRYRSGSEGLSQLTEFKATTEISFRPGVGRFTVVAEPIFLTAGSMPGDYFTVRNFGAMALLGEDGTYAPAVENAGGLGLGVRFEAGGLTLEGGTTPLGFEVTNAIGLASFEHFFRNGFGFKIVGERSAVTDSVTSFSGVFDPVSRELIGGVINNEVGVSFSQDFGGSGLYANFRTGIVTGDNIEDNENAAADLGFYLAMMRKEQHSFTGGFNLTYLTYEDNRRFFSLGHGGYFSPQSFLAATVPMTYKYESDRWSVTLDGAIGVQYYQEDAEWFYPLHPTLQIELIALMEDQPVIYDEVTETDISLRGSVDFVYKLTPSLELNGGLSFDRTANFTEALGFLRVNYWPRNGN